MKNFPFLILSCTFLLACSAPSPDSEAIDLQAEEERVLDSLHEEPMRNGTKEVLKENGVTTEIWSYQEEHGSPHKIVETLIYKNGKLVSHTISDSAKKFAFSRQYQDGKVIELSEVQGDRYSTWYLKDEKPAGRTLIQGKKSECAVYENGRPVAKEMAECEKRFNTAP